MAPLSHFGGEKAASQFAGGRALRDAKLDARRKAEATRGPTGYLLYTKELRPEVKAEMDTKEEPFFGISVTRKTHSDSIQDAKQTSRGCDHKE